MCGGFEFTMEKNLKKIIIVVLLSAFTVTPALADDNTGKWYIAGDIGSATYSNISPFPNPGVIQIALGSHFNQNFAGELGYSKFGDSSITGPGGTATVSASAFHYAIIGSLPLNPQFDLTGKLGYTRNSYDVTSTFGISGSSSNTSLLFGVGAQYHINSRVSIRAQYDNYGKFENVSNPMEATSITLGVTSDF
jgi:OOP family OmpA-OmpF porin